MSFKYRSNQKELLDKADIPFEDIQRNMQELDFINRDLGGHKITIKALRSSINGSFLNIAEIGCGGGDNLRVIKDWGNKKEIKMKLTGIDMNRECIRFAKEKISNTGINFICTDYRLVHFDEPQDIIFSSLFCHHFSNDELVAMMQWMHHQSRVGFFINDLHRHPVAYYSIKMLTKAFSKSYMVRHDAPLSVKRGLRRKEWADIFSRAGLDDYEIKWQWAFRWLITCYKNDEGSKKI